MRFRPYKVRHEGGAVVNGERHEANVVLWKKSKVDLKIASGSKNLSSNCLDESVRMGDAVVW